MLYTLLCYNKEAVVWSWSKEEDDAVMDRLSVVHEKLVKEGKLGPSLRLLPIAATTLRGRDMVIDGPFAETKEWQRALDCGCEVRMKPENMFWGDRFAQCKDPFGVTWAFVGPQT
jgi:YCII-related domain